MYENSITVKCISKVRSSLFQNVLTSNDGDIIRVHINISCMFDRGYLPNFGFCRQNQSVRKLCFPMDMADMWSLINHFFKSPVGNQLFKREVHGLL